MRKINFFIAFCSALGTVSIFLEKIFKLNTILFSLIMTVVVLSYFAKDKKMKWWAFILYFFTNYIVSYIAVFSIIRFCSLRFFIKNLVWYTFFYSIWAGFLYNFFRSLNKKEEGME